MEFSETLKRRFEEIKHRFPTGQSALMPALYAVQEELGCISIELQQAVAGFFSFPAEKVREAVTFYFMFNQKPVGRYHIYICGNISCWLRGYGPLKDFLQQKLSIQDGQTTTDGRFTLSTVECLGMCDHAPVMQINGTFYEDLTVEKIDDIIDSLSRFRPAQGAVVNSGELP